MWLKLRATMVLAPIFVAGIIVWITGIIPWIHAFFTSGIIPWTASIMLWIGGTERVE